MLIGDQTQSNLLRVSLQKVGDVEQGSVMPFFEGLESGVMRPLFLPDGSLLLGQTGRGWQAKGGKVASLQHVRWDGKTMAPADDRDARDAEGIQAAIHAAARQWRERGAAARPRWRSNRGRIAMRRTTARPNSICATRRIASLAIAADRKSMDIALASIEHAEGASAPDGARVSREARGADVVRRECAGADECVLHAVRVSGEVIRE